jgi:hypothetical protein
MSLKNTPLSDAFTVASVPARTEGFFMDGDMKTTKQNIHEKLRRDRLAKDIRAARNNPFVCLSDPLYDAMPHLRESQTVITGLYSEKSAHGSRHVFIQRRMRLPGMEIYTRGDRVHVERHEEGSYG